MARGSVTLYNGHVTRYKASAGQKAYDNNRKHSSTDASLKKYVEEVINGSETQNNITMLDEIPDSLASEINRIIGINPIRYRAEIRKQEIWHI